MNYFDIFKDEKKDEDMKKVIPTVFSSIEYTIHNIIKKIELIDSLSDEELKDIIIRQHSMIFNYDLFLKNDESRRSAQVLFTNERFLKILSSIIGGIPLTSEEIICINKIVYDYYRIQNQNYVLSPESSQDILGLLMIISYQINNTTVIRLYAKLGVNGARILAMIANSSFRADKRIHRVNSFLIRCNLELSLQDIVDIYCILFDRITNLFIYTMLESKQSGMNNEQLKRFDMISQAMLVLLDSLTTNGIKQVLYDYAYTMKLQNNYKVRFSLKSANQFPRIQSAVKTIEFEDFENLIIP